IVNQRNYLQYVLADEIIINIFKHVKYPFDLLLSCKKFYAISKDCQARAEWIIFQYGKAHCLFHAIKLGPTFINVEVAQLIVARGGILSRYFVQKLLIHFGSYDEKLIKLKITFNVGQVNIDQPLYQKIRPPWASDLQVSVFTFLLSKAYDQLGASDMCGKGNDMELFHFLTAGPYTISRAPNILEKNIECIKDLILRMKFVPFPPRPSPNQFSALLLLFPPTPPAEWIKPDVKTINARLIELINIGFQLSYAVIGTIFHLFEN
ncbi:2675_t:CDS:2, partial [Cetraspora pellucida]